MACTAIRHVHRMAGAEDPVASETVRQVRRGLMRTYGAAPRRLARPLAVDEIRQIISGIDRTTPIGIRDSAIILLGYASAMRRAEIVGLDLADVEHKPAGLLLTIRKSKRIRMVMVRRSPSLTDSTHSPTRWPRSMPGEQCGASPPAPSSLAYGPARSASNRYRHMSQPACSAPGRRRRARRHPHHGTLFAGRPCTRRRDGRRPPGPDRGADKTQGPHRPGQPLHPAAGSPRDDVEPRPRAMTSAWGEDPWGQFGRPGAPLARSRSSAGSGPLTCGNACIQWPWGATGTHETR
jgi:hypothetical protein